MTAMKAVVTGGLGFIGSHLADAMADAGADVHVIDSRNSASFPYRNRLVTYHQLDIRDASVIPLIVQIKPDVIYHLAAQVDVQQSIKQTAEDAGINILGTIRILEAARRSGNAKVVYASSCAVYGDSNRPVIEETQPPNPVSFYGTSKLVPELYLHVYRHLYGLPFTVLRYANVYGPRQTAKGEGGVIAIFMDRLKRGLPWTVYGDGEQTRDFVYVRDVVRANLAAAALGNGETLHVSTGVPSTVNGVVAILRELHDAPIRVDYAPERPGDIRDSCLSNNKTIRVLQWSPEYSLRRGLRETYEQVVRQIQ